MLVSKIFQIRIDGYRWFLLGIIPLFTSCGVYFTFPGKTVWFAYPADSALVPPHFSVVVGGVRTSAGWGSEAYGGDVGGTSSAYDMAALPLEVLVDGKPVATLANQPVHQFTLSLSPGTHQLTVRPAEGRRAPVDHIQVTVLEAYPYLWVPYRNSRMVQDTIWHHRSVQRVALENGHLMVWQNGQRLHLIYRLKGRTVWRDSLKGYIYSQIIPFNHGVYLPVMPFRPQLLLYWVDTRGVTPVVTVTAENLWFEPWICTKGFAFATFSGPTAQLYLFNDDGTFTVADSPPAPADAMVFPGAFCADSMILPQWTIRHNRGNSVELRTPRANFTLPPHLITGGNTYQLLAVHQFWLLDNAKGIFGYWQGRWWPVYLPLETFRSPNWPDCQPPKIGVGLLGVLPIPVVNGKLRCSLSLQFAIQNYWVVGPFGEYYRLSVKNYQ